MKKIAFATSAIMLASCASTSSVVIPEVAPGDARMAIVPFDGEYGSQASELIALEFAKRGIAVIEGSEVFDTFRLDTDFTEAEPERVAALKDYGDKLDVDYVFVGTAQALSGPLYSFDHVKMTMRMIDVNTGQTRWIGEYGNSLWTSAISTQGDIDRGSKHIVREFDKSGADDLIR